MLRKFSLLLTAVLALGVLALFVGCSDDSTDNPIVPTVTVTVTSPVAAVVWYAGTVHNITWTDQNVDTFTIEYSTNSGTTWIAVAANLTAATYAWTIPSTPATTCKVRVSKTNEATVYDESGTFTIAAMPALVGTWMANDTAMTHATIGVDSMRYSFTLDSNYSATQWITSTDIVETGDYLDLDTATNDSIRFHVLTYDGNPPTDPDSSYIRKYTLTGSTTLNIQVFGLTEDLLRDTLWTVIFHKQ